MLVSNSLVFQGWPWNYNPPAGILNTGITDQASFHYYLKDSPLRTIKVILRNMISLIKWINITVLLNQYIQNHISPMKEKYLDMHQMWEAIPERKFKTIYTLEYLWFVWQYVSLDLVLPAYT